jgi:uncharacterized membrane protein
VVDTLTIVAAVGASVSGGVFFAFSTFVMRALDRLPEREAISAMQAINKAAPSPLFMTALFGTAAVSVVVGVMAVGRLDEPSAVYVLVGTGLYLAGIVLTAAYHVPRNDALSRVDLRRADPVRVELSRSDAHRIWRDYAVGWTRWNHVRTLTSIGAAVSFILALGAD